MALTQTTSSAALTSLRFAAQIAQSSARRCPQCLRTFSSSRPFQVSLKRKLQTSTAYHPQNLEPPPPPPRNTFTRGSPITEATGSKADVKTIAPQEELTQHNTAQSEISASTTTPLHNKKESPKSRRFNFAPRKATIKLTPTAVGHLRQLLDQPEPKLIRIGTKNRGCSGLAYHLEYVDKPGKFDEVVEQDGVKVLIESRTLLHIIGSEMDWKEDKLSARFVFNNPNISKFDTVLRHYENTKRI
jgi:iron-sulfur cluster assembly 1